jgi:beta-glucosidase
MGSHKQRSYAIAVCGLLVFAAGTGVCQAGERAASLLAQMSLEEKLALIRGEVEPALTNQGQAGWLAGVKRLGIAPLRLADGPPGVLTREPSPALTATMGLAATFSRTDARDNGIVIGDEANRLGVGIVLEPFINIDRDLAFDRGYNTYGEDPLLSGAIAADLVKGIQSRGVMAQAKHYVGYDTGGADVAIASQVLHEVYLAPFDDAVKAGVSSIMCSYNRINGPYACGNPETLIDVLRGELKFDGFVTSDWGAVHDYDYLAKGLDMEMPGRPAKGDPGAFYGRSFFDTDPPRIPTADDLAKLPPVNLFTGRVPEEPAAPIFALTPPTGDYKNLSNALSEGVVTTAMIDRAALRVLGQMERFGYFDGSHEALVQTTSGLRPQDVILRTAEDAAVLLKNKGALPLSEKSGSIALIGPGAAQVVAIGKSGERSVGLAERQIGPYAALRQVMPGADLRLAVANDMTGVAVPADRLARGEGGIGLSHVVNDQIDGVDAVIDFTGIRSLPPDERHSWTGTLVVPSPGRYVLAVQTLGARGVLTVDGKLVAQSSGSQGAGHGDTLIAGQDDVMPTRDGLNNARGAVELTAGPHAVSIDVRPDGSGDPERVRFAWVTPQMQTENFQAAVDAAAAAKTAVVFVWSRDVPLFALSGDQDKLVEAVAAANPNTVVVTNISQPVAMPWLSKVKAVVQMWWPGDEGGQATANILSGRKNPAGRLPFTWGKAIADYPATDPKFPERSGSNPDGKTRFSEGLDVGYRWFERKGVAPLYPFGYGLSYTRFVYSKLKLARRPDGGLDIHFTLKNAGAADGEEVPQVYLSPPQKPVAGAAFALKALAGFDRVALKAGESRAVTITVDRRRLQYWSATDKKWIDAGSTRTLSVGASSQDLRLKTVVP